MRAGASRLIAAVVAVAALGGVINGAAITASPAYAASGGGGDIGGGGGGGGGGNNGGGNTPTPKRPHVNPPPPQVCNYQELVYGEQTQYRIQRPTSITTLDVTDWQFGWTPQGSMSSVIGVTVCNTNIQWVNPDDDTDTRVTWDNTVTFDTANGFSTNCPGVGGVWGQCRCLTYTRTTVVGPLNPYPASLEPVARDAAAMRAYWRNPTGALADSDFSETESNVTSFGAGWRNGNRSIANARDNCYNEFHASYAFVNKALVHPGRYPLKSHQWFVMLTMYDVSGDAATGRRRTAGGGRPDPGFHIENYGAAHEAERTLDDIKFVVVPDCRGNGAEQRVDAWPDGGDANYYNVRACPGDTPATVNGVPADGSGSIPRYNFRWACINPKAGPTVTTAAGQTVRGTGTVKTVADNRINTVDFGSTAWWASTGVLPGTTRYAHKFTLGGHSPNPDVNMSPHYSGTDFGNPWSTQPGSDSVNDASIQRYSTVRLDRLGDAADELAANKYTQAVERANWSMLNVRVADGAQQANAFGVLFDTPSISGRTWTVGNTVWHSGLYRLTGQVMAGVRYDPQTGDLVAASGSHAVLKTVTFDTQLTFECRGPQVSLVAQATR